jgi:hypothetical protein
VLHLLHRNVDSKFATFGSGKSLRLIENRVFEAIQKYGLHICVLQMQRSNVTRLRLHDFAREDIQLAIFLFPHFGNLEWTNLIAAHH